MPICTCELRELGALRAHRKRQAEEKLRLGPAYADRDLVFCLEDGSPPWPQSFSRMFERHANAAGLPRIRFHDLRHSAATRWLLRGDPIHVVAKRLGDAEETVLGTYAHVLPGSDELIADQDEALLASRLEASS